MRTPAGLDRHDALSVALAKRRQPLYGGGNEIQHNILARAVLNLSSR